MICAENTPDAEGAESGAGMPFPRMALQIEGTGVGDAGFAGIASFDAADAEELFTAAFEVGFDGFYVRRWHD